MVKFSTGTKLSGNLRRRHEKSSPTSAGQSVRENDEGKNPTVSYIFSIKGNPVERGGNHSGWGQLGQPKTRVKIPKNQDHSQEVSFTW